MNQPKTISEMLIDNKTKRSIETLINSLNFKILFYGGAGTGKTTLAYLIAKQKDLNIIESNMSDERTVEDIRRLEGQILNKTLTNHPNLYLFDEIDGIKQKKFFTKLKNLIEKSTYPVILTCNEVWKIPENLKKVVKLVEIKPARKSLMDWGINNPYMLDVVQLTDIRALKTIKEGQSDGYMPVNNFRDVGMFFKNGCIGLPKLKNLKLWILENIPNFSYGRQMYENYQLLALADRLGRDEILGFIKSNKRGDVSYPDVLRKRK